MQYIKWVLLAILAFMLGFFVVEYMTVHPLMMSSYLLLSAIVGFIIIILLAMAFKGARLLPIALLVAIVAFLAGYVIRTETFLGREDDRPLPELTREKGDPGDSQTAVVYFKHGEP